jgi:hypothetical protein
MARKSSSRHKNYPHRGTKAGDALIGTCDGRDCGVELRRGDPFVTTVSGHLVCRPCWEKPDSLGLDTFAGPATSEHIAEAVKILDANEIAEDFGPDNPFF